MWAAFLNAYASLPNGWQLVFGVTGMLFALGLPLFLLGDFGSRKDTKALGGSIMLISALASIIFFILYLFTLPVPNRY